MTLSKKDLIELILLGFKKNKKPKKTKPKKEEPLPEYYSNSEDEEPPPEYYSNSEDEEPFYFNKGTIYENESESESDSDEDYLNLQDLKTKKDDDDDFYFFKEDYNKDNDNDFGIGPRNLNLDWFDLDSENEENEERDYNYLKKEYEKQQEDKNFGLTPTKLDLDLHDLNFDIGDTFGEGKMSIIQSVLVPKSKFTKKEAIKYVKKHFKFRKIDENQRKNFYSFRQFDPTKGSKYSTKVLKNGVELVLEYKPKKGGSLSVKTIYKSIKNGYNYPNIENLDDYQYNKHGSDKEIQLYVNHKDKKIIINFIGTYHFLDWYNNYKYVKGQYTITKRYKRAREAFIKITDDYPDYKVVLIGHSQSAVITRLLNQEFPNRIFEVINLNGANLGEKEKENEYNIRSKFDLVSLLHKPTSRDVIIKNESNNILTEHKPDILKRLNQDREIGR
jgi:hypothetical protein